MRASRATLLIAAATLAACADAGTGAALPAEAPLHLAAAGKGIAGRYIVVLRGGARPDAVAAGAGAAPTHVYRAAVNGFAAALSPAQVAALRHNPAVVYLEQDQAAEAYAAPWGLDRIDQHYLPLDGVYNATATGANVNAYIIDTGIQASHAQFVGRAVNVYDYAGGTGADCNGHGTHVAGIVGGTTYGVARQARLRGVRVLDCNGAGSASAVIAGIDWVRLNHAKPAVATLSLGAPYSATVNAAVTNLSNAGVFVAVAAGNSNADACGFSPASAPAAFTTASSEKTDARRTSSNFGTCVDGYAPGGSIVSAFLNSTSNTLSGSSMAAAHVAGVAVLYKATFGDAASSVVDLWIKNNATAGVITGNPAGTPNRLLYKGTL